MARSLTVNHDEKPSTTPLFTAFLVLAIGWLAAATLFNSGADAEAPAEAVQAVAPH